MNFDVARAQMLGQQIRAWEVLDDRVLRALEQTPRERFVPEEYRDLAFADTEIPLANGLTGHYKGLSCGASCAPPLIEWVQDGVLYTIQADAGTKRTERRRIVALANSAIRNGPR